MESVGKRVRKSAKHEEYISDASLDVSDSRRRSIKKSDAPVRGRKNTWSEREDALLSNGVEMHGATASSWMKIASMFRGKRDSKQCRERWMEYLNPEHNREPFLEEEDAALLQLEREHGRHWRLIQKKLQDNFPPRSATRIKSRWYQLHKRAQQSSAEKTVEPQISPPLQPQQLSNEQSAVTAVSSSDVASVAAEASAATSRISWPAAMQYAPAYPSYTPPVYHYSYSAPPQPSWHSSSLYTSHYGASNTMALMSPYPMHSYMYMPSSSQVPYSYGISSAAGYGVPQQAESKRDIN